MKFLIFAIMAFTFANAFFGGRRIPPFGPAGVPPIAAPFPAPFPAPIAAPLAAVDFNYDGIVDAFVPPPAFGGYGGYPAIDGFGGDLNSAGFTFIPVNHDDAGDDGSRRRF